VAGRALSRRPALPEGPDGLSPTPAEHERRQHAGRFQRLVARPQALYGSDHFVELAVLEDAALAVFRRARLETDDAGGPVDLPPLERQDLAVDAPAGEVGER